MERLKILITGGTGFIGANLVHHFYSNDHDIAITLRDESNMWRISDILENIDLFKTDITDTQKVGDVLNSYKPDIVIHTAAFGGYHFETDTKRIFDVNLNATIGIVEAYLRSNAELLINTGSSSEYGFKTNPMSEIDLLEPIGAYAVSKAASSLYCKSRSIETNHKIVTLRLFSVFGYYEESHRLVPYVLLSSLKRKTAKMNDPNNVRDFIFIEDICYAYEELIKKVNNIGPGEIFNLGSGKETKVEKIVNMVDKISDEKLNVEWEYGSERIGDKAFRWIADLSKTSNILKWKPKHSLEEGLSKTYHWLKNNISKYEVMENSKARNLGK